MRVIIEGQPVPTSASEAPELPLRSVSSGYFEMLGLPIIEGRDFRSNDVEDAPPRDLIVAEHMPDAVGVCTAPARPVGRLGPTVRSGSDFRGRGCD
jgi:hypothetical protein